MQADPAPDVGAASAHPFRSVHDGVLPALLGETASSVLVSTYETGHVVILRADGDDLNTHFRRFEMPMGIAYGPGRLAVGTRRQVWLHTDAVPAAVPEAPHDAYLLPRVAWMTGNILVHELTWGDDELWIVNTRFSCLCTLDARHSFTPRWAPGFVTALAPEDRCHLNGVCVVEGRPRFATALGSTDTAEGWREVGATGGCVIDVDSGEVAVPGLFLPHSPRWHAGRLWLLESGRGSLAVAELASGRVETVAVLPGFTRGLAFVGRYALVGLSMARDPGVRSFAPSGTDALCGICVVDSVSGRIVGLLRFDGVVREVFDVQVLPGLRWPDIGEPDDLTLSERFSLPPG